MAIELDGLASYAQSQTASVRATAFYNSGSHADVTDQVVWTSSNTALLAFTGNGGQFTNCNVYEMLITTSAAQAATFRSELATRHSITLP